MRTSLLFIILVFFGIELSTQNILVEDADTIHQDVRKERPFGITGVLGGPTLFGPSINIFVVTQLNFNASWAPTEEWRGYAVGFQYHFKKRLKSRGWSPYFGMQYARIEDDLHFICFGSCPSYDLSLFYFPVGVAWMARSGFTISFEGAVMHEYNLTTNNREHIGPWFGVNIGYRFRRAQS